MCTAEPKAFALQILGGVIILPGTITRLCEFTTGTTENGVREGSEVDKQHTLETKKSTLKKMNLEQLKTQRQNCHTVVTD